MCMAIGWPIGKGKGRHTSMPWLLIGKDRHTCYIHVAQTIKLGEMAWG